MLPQASDCLVLVFCWVCAVFWRCVGGILVACWYTVGSMVFVLVAGACGRGFVAVSGFDYG